MHRAKLSEILEKNESPQPLEKIELLSTYAEALFFWNRKVNLFSRKLGTDELLADIAEAVKVGIILNGEGIKKVLDLGSGNGIPGIPIAITQDIETTLVEINEKKASFMKFCISKLNLSISVKNCDAMEMKDLDDCITRAMEKIDEKKEDISKKLLPGKRLFIMKGAQDADEREGVRYEFQEKKRILQMIPAIEK